MILHRGGGTRKEATSSLDATLGGETGNWWYFNFVNQHRNMPGEKMPRHPLVTVRYCVLFMRKVVPSRDSTLVRDTVLIV